MKQYNLVDCFRNVTNYSETNEQKCEKVDFGNGDRGFYYTDECLILKVDGDLWYMDYKQNTNLFYILNWFNPMFKYWKSGKVERQSVGSYDLYQETEERFYKFKNNTMVVDNLITGQRKYFDNYGLSN